MNPTEIEFAVKALVAEPYDPATFPFDLIAIYNTPKVTVSKLKSGQTNAATAPGDVLWKKHLFFRSAAAMDDVAAIADSLVADPLTTKHKPRFILVTNGNQVHIRDLTLDDTCNVDFERLDESSDFLLPLAGFERRVAIAEHPTDVKAAKRLAKLYSAILVANPTWSDGNHTHELNLFMTRALFCFYAEDTGIFDIPQIFTNTVTQHTSEDGSDLAPLLDRLFRVMNLKQEERPANTSAVEARFPYVNGSLFEATLPIPAFNRTARRLFLECGELDWRTINPDIFGSMIQTIAEPGARGDIGMHYTSTPNIMKVLQPLFLDELNDAYDKAKDSVKRLEALLTRLAHIRVFDPACGCGNFLIVAYKELRQIEMRVLTRISELARNNPLRLSGIVLHNFFGIDVVDFACETTKLSLWIAEYQMNSAFKELFGTARPPLPLGKIATVHCANSLRIDWFDVCPRDEHAETYICGNPPYGGSARQSRAQKDDVDLIFSPITASYKDVDYVACWFIKATDYVANSNRSYAALVATNSICQGEQVAFLWPYVFHKRLKISFAHTSFAWENNAANNAGVACVIVGIAATSSPTIARLYTADHVQNVQIIGPYLVPGNTLVVRKESNPLNTLPLMLRGNMPTDNGNLILSPSERSAIVSSHPEAAMFIRPYIGSDEFINHVERYCLWITDDKLAFANTIPPIRARIAAVADFRRKSVAQSTAAYAALSHRFRQIQRWGKPALLLPIHASERREYIPIGLIGDDAILSNAAFAVYDPPTYLLALLSSRIHMVWCKTVGGHLENRIRYSNSLVYNTFPLPHLSGSQQQILTDHSKVILRARAKHPGKTIAWLYNPETMPDNLLVAHHENDAYLEQSVYGRAFKDDTQRLEHLFAMYAIMKDKDIPPLLAAPERRASMANQ